MPRSNARRAAVELNNGDLVAFGTEIENSAADSLDVRVTVDAPDAIDIDVRNSETDTGRPGDVTDLDPDDDGTSGRTNDAVQTGEGTYVAVISGTEDVDIIAELDDTADPGSYDIGVAINPLSTNG